MQTWRRISRVRPETVWPAPDALERDPPTTAHVLWSPAKSGHLCRFIDAYPASASLDCSSVRLVISPPLQRTSCRYRNHPKRTQSARRTAAEVTRSLRCPRLPLGWLPRPRCVRWLPLEPRRRPHSGSSQRHGTSVRDSYPGDYLAPVPLAPAP